MVAYYTSTIPLAYQGIKQHIDSLSTLKDVILLHDMYAFSTTTQMGFWERFREKRWLSQLVKGPQPIYVLSAHMQNELKRFFPSIKAEIKIITPKADDLIQPNDEDARDVVRYQFTQGDAYFICTAPIHGAANIIPLLKGFSQFKKRTNSNMKLVFTGVKGSFSSEILLSVDTYKHRNDLVFLENLSASDKRDLLCSAYALVHPCRYERFGLPIFDALKAGVAILTAEKSSMSELTGMAGMFFDEENGAEIGERLIRIYNDEQMRAEMIGTGLLRFR